MYDDDRQSSGLSASHLKERGYALVAFAELSGGGLVAELSGGGLVAELSGGGLVAELSGGGPHSTT
jgi:hypothetical protein